MAIFLTVLPGALFRAQAGNLFTKMSHHKYLTLFQKCLLPVKEKYIILYDFTKFYIILYNSINCEVFIDIKQTLH